MSSVNPNQEPDTFAPTMPLLRGAEAETQALVAGDLGDPSYRIDSFAESLDLMRKVEQSSQAVTLVLLDIKPGNAPEVVQAFSSRLLHVNEETQTMDMELPLLSPPHPKGQTLRGSVRLQGVFITFEAESLGTREQPNGTQMLRARLPFRLYRLQRRDSFRVPVPSSSGVFITLKTGMRYLENLKAMDLSCGGVSVMVRAPVDAVHLGKRFPGAWIRLGGLTGNENYQVDMLIRHVRMAPAGLSQMLAATAPAMRMPPPGQSGGKSFREAAMAAVGALMQPELLQLGIEFERMPTALDRSLARLVNELGVNLMTRVRNEE